MVRSYVSSRTVLMVCSALIVACGSGETLVPKPVGAWVQISAGTTSEIRWEVYRAAAEDGDHCLSLDLDPPPRPGFFAEVAPDSVYRGRPAGCLLESGDIHSRRPAQIAWDAAGAVNYTFLLGAAGPGTRLVANSEAGVCHENVLDSPEFPEIFLFIAPTADPIASIVLQKGDERVVCEFRRPEGVPTLRCS